MTRNILNSRVYQPTVTFLQNTATFLNHIISATPVTLWKGWHAALNEHLCHAAPTYMKRLSLFVRGGRAAPTYMKRFLHPVRTANEGPQRTSRPCRFVNVFLATPVTIFQVCTRLQHAILCMHSPGARLLRGEDLCFPIISKGQTGQWQHLRHKIMPDKKGQRCASEGR